MGLALLLFFLLLLLLLLLVIVSFVLGQSLYMDYLYIGKTDKGKAKGSVSLNHVHKLIGRGHPLAVFICTSTAFLPFLARCVRLAGRGLFETFTLYIDCNSTPRIQYPIDYEL